MSPPASGQGPEQIERVRIARKYKLEFAVDPEFMEKLAKVRSLLSTKHPKGMDFQTIFDILLREYLDRHDPEKKISRRNARREKNNTPREMNIKSYCGANAPRKDAERTRHITQEIRDEVFKRDGGRCSFIGPDGKRCDSRWNLEIDHIIPFARGGDNSPENLRLLCAVHNKLAAERTYGTDFMERYYRRE